MRKLPSLAFITITLMLSANASRAQSFAPQVLPYIKIQPGTIALTDVKIVDGTGKGTKSDGAFMLAYLQCSRDSSTWVLYKKELLWEKRFVEMGGRLMAGVDPTGAGRVIPGYADRHSLELLVEAGFSFPEAVKGKAGLN